jgi:hypothetical protein
MGGMRLIEADDASFLAFGPRWKSLAQMMTASWRSIPVAEEVERTVDF